MINKDEAARRRASRFNWGPGDVEIIESAAPKWSEEARKATRTALEAGSALAAMSNDIAFKHHDGRFALLTQPNLRPPSVRLVDRKTGVVSAFDDADALLEAGWVLD